MSMFCEHHRRSYYGYTEGHVGGSECPVCVREERDRLRIIVKGLEEESADKVMWREEAQRLRALCAEAETVMREHPGAAWMSEKLEQAGGSVAR